jgi:hypothetical protein
MISSQWGRLTRLTGRGRNARRRSPPARDHNGARLTEVATGVWLAAFWALAVIVVLILVGAFTQH